VPELVIRPEAEWDIADAAAWYERERRGLAARFLAELRTTFNRINAGPERFPRVSGECRRAILRRFPYGVFFVADAEIVTVLAVLHLHRNPATWERRISSG